jgi:ribosomal protein L36
MKVRASVRRICKDCQIIRRRAGKGCQGRHGRRKALKPVVMVRCRVIPKHNQRQG